MMTKIRSFLARDVLEHLLDLAIAKQKNELRIEGAQRKVIAKSIAAALQELEDDTAKAEGRAAEAVKPLSDRRIKSALTVLVGAGVVERYGRGLYRLNPSMYYVGGSDGQVSSMEDYRSRQIAKQRATKS